MNKAFFEVYIVDVAQKVSKIEIFCIFWYNCTIMVTLQFFFVLLLEKKSEKNLSSTQNNASFMEKVFFEPSDTLQTVTMGLPFEHMKF